MPTASKSRKRQPTKAEQEKLAAQDRQARQTEATHRVADATSAVAGAQHRVANLIDGLIGQLQSAAPSLPKVPSKYQQLVQGLQATTVAVASLFLTQGLITNATEKAVAGGASVLIPLVVVAGIWVSQAMHSNATARVSAAHVTAKLDSTVAAIKTAHVASLRAANALDNAASVLPVATDQSAPQKAS